MDALLQARTESRSMTHCDSKSGGYQSHDISTKLNRMIEQGNQLPSTCDQSTVPTSIQDKRSSSQQRRNSVDKINELNDRVNLIYKRVNKSSSNNSVHHLPQQIQALLKKVCNDSSYSKYHIYIDQISILKKKHIKITTEWNKVDKWN